MGPRLQVALLALAVIAASGQCVVACSTELCHISITPPCHRHHPTNHQTCKHVLFVAEAPASAVAHSVTPPTDLGCAVPVLMAGLALPMQSNALHAEGASPPGSLESEQHSVLRI